MSDRASLPLFVREALADDESPARAEAGGSPGAISQAGAAGTAGAQAEIEAGLADELDHCFASLLEAAWPANAALAASARIDGLGPSVALFERLEATLGEAPHRYAPFFARAAELFDLSEEAVAAELARLAEPKVWRFAGLPGIHHVAVRGGPRVEAAETLFVRFAPGVRFPRHRHTGLERVLVLEGSYVDTNGVAHRAGELKEWAEGTEHGFRVDLGQPCIFASVVFGRRFKAWPLRALASVLGR